MRKLLSSADIKLTTGSPYWPVRNEPVSQHDALTENAACDVAIIGGGITGALIAYRMVAAGLDVILVDKARFGSGSTTASTALVSYEFDEMLTGLGKMVGERNALRAYELCYAATARVKALVHELEDPCDYDDKVSIRVSNNLADTENFSKEAALRTRHGMSVDLLDRDRLESRFGITAELGLVSDNAAQIDPFKLTRRLIHRATKRSLRAYEKTKVTTFDGGPKGVRLGCATGATIQAKHVIFATGYESEKYLKTKSTRTTDFCFISNALKSTPKLGKCHVVENADFYLYLSTFGNRIMAGIEGKTFYGPAERSRLMARKIREVMERVGLYLPSTKLTVDYHWASTFVNSPDSLPYLGSVARFPRAIFALGYGGNGIASSATLAPLLVDLVTKGTSPEAKIFRLDR